MKKHLALRTQMQALAIDALIIPSTDPHFSEYTASYWNARKWLSGFTGSAGTLVFTLTEAALWTDSRYFVQAEQQLQGTGIVLQKEGLPDTPDMISWLIDHLDEGAIVGIDAQLCSMSAFKEMEAQLYPDLELRAINDPFVEIWTDRKPIVHQAIQLIPETITGASHQVKRQQISTQKSKSARYFVSALDEIAWLFNIRGTDVAYNPVVTAYALVGADGADLFIATEQLNDTDRKQLEADEVRIHAYSDIQSFIKDLSPSIMIELNPTKTNYQLYQLFANKRMIHHETDRFGKINRLKSIKNPVELDGFRQAMVLDGVALIKFWRWLHDTVYVQSITEIDVAQQLQRFRAENPDYISDSFATIAAFGSNGALPHYHARPDTTATLHANKEGTSGFLLVDSGAHYRFGTTDITRMFYFGTPSISEKHHYTLVLKGMIALSSAQFIAGTRGANLDILARQYLWQAGKNYGHGTGHGVGHYLNVHEGPQSVRQADNGVAIDPGMVISNEPGFYQPGAYGIRIENLLACQQHITTEYGDFHHFETLSLCPINTDILMIDELCSSELAWLNHYHANVFKQLSPLLKDEDLLLLKKLTDPIKK